MCFLKLLSTSSDGPFYHTNYFSITDLPVHKELYPADKTLYWSKYFGLRHKNVLLEACFQFIQPESSELPGKDISTNNP
jgi:hypothetical protein